MSPNDLAAVLARSSPHVQSEGPQEHLRNALAMLVALEQTGLAYGPTELRAIRQRVATALAQLEAA